MLVPLVLVLLLAVNSSAPQPVQQDVNRRCLVLLLSLFPTLLSLVMFALRQPLRLKTDPVHPFSVSPRSVPQMLMPPLSKLPPLLSVHEDIDLALFGPASLLVLEPTARAAL